MSNSEAGERLAWYGGAIYKLADLCPEMEKDKRFADMMFALNELSYKFIHGEEREQAQRREEPNNA